MEVVQEEVAAHNTNKQKSDSGMLKGQQDDQQGQEQQVGGGAGEPERCVGDLNPEGGSVQRGSHPDLGSEGSPPAA